MPLHSDSRRNKVQFPRYKKGQIEGLFSNEKMEEIMTSQNLLFISGSRNSVLGIVRDVVTIVHAGREQNRGSIPGRGKRFQRVYRNLPPAVKKWPVCEFDHSPYLVPRAAMA